MKYRVKRHEVVQPLDASYRLIPLTQGQNAIVDIEDYEWLSQWNWGARWSKSTRSFYAMRTDRTTGKKTICMHSLLLGSPNGSICDHKNHNTIDNRRENLRASTYEENGHNRERNSNNRSGFKGVWHEGGKWVSSIRVGKGNRIYLGSFDSKEDAAMAYDAAAKMYHGDFACLNKVNH